MPVFGSVLIGVYILMLAYVLWRASSVVRLISKTTGRKFVIVPGALAGLVFPFARLGFRQSESSLSSVLQLAGMSLLGSVFLLFVTMLAADLLTGFGLLLKRQALPLRAGALALGLSFAAWAHVQAVREPEVVDYELTLPSLAPELDGTVVVALSDTHIGRHLDDTWMAARISQVHALKPDLVVLLGDIIEGRRPVSDRMREVLKSLSAPMGVWFVYGNHDRPRGNPNGPGPLDGLGFERLDDRWAQVKPGLILAGVGDLTSRRRRGEIGDPMQKVLANRPSGATILLTHTPWCADLAQKAGAELMLSGHTHGGQVWPFGYLVRTVHPLLQGLYHVNGMPVIVSRGTGTWGPRMRLWARGEISRITLRARK